jgi:hypothetical protein
MLNFTKNFLTIFVKNVFAIENSEKNSFEAQSHEAFYFTKKSLRIEIPRIVGIVLFLVSSGFFMTANAQKDQLTTQAGEQIRCKILDETPTRFVYAYLRKDGKVLRNEIFKSLVTEFKYNFYPNDLVDSKGRLLPLGDAIAKKNSSSEDKKSTIKEDSKKESSKDEAKVVSNKRSSDGQKPSSKSDENASVKSNERINSSKNDERNSSRNSESISKSDGNSVVKSNEKSSPSKINNSEKLNNSEKSKNTDNSEKNVSSTNKPDTRQASESSSASKSEEKKSGGGLFSRKSSDTKKAESSSNETAKTNKTDDKKVVKTNEKVDSKAETAKNQTKKQSTARPSVEQKVEDSRDEKPVIESEMAKTEEQEKATTLPLAAQPQNGVYKNYLKFRVGARGGFASLLTKTALTDEYSKYKQGTETGWMFGADAAFFPVHNVGIGVMYTNFQSSNSSPGIKYKNIIDNKEITGTGAVSDKISNKLLAGVLYYRKNIDYKTFIILGVAPGMNLYSNERVEDKTIYNISGKQFGGAATLGVDFLLGNDIIGRDIILSVEGEYNYAKFDKLDYGNGKGAIALPTPQDNSHWSVSIGLRFTRYPKYLRLTSY